MVRVSRVLQLRPQHLLKNLEHMQICRGGRPHSHLWRNKYHFQYHPTLLRAFAEPDAEQEDPRPCQHAQKPPESWSSGTIIDTQAPVASRHLPMPIPCGVRQLCVEFQLHWP